MDDLVGHHRRYTKRELERLLEEAGFTLIESGYTDVLGYFATLLFRLLDKFKSDPDGTINKPLLIVYDRVVFPVSRALSTVTRRWFGKNVYVLAEKPSAESLSG